MIKAKISHYYHSVDNIEASIIFFRDILGLEMVYGHLTDTSTENDVKDKDINSVDISKLKWVEFHSEGIAFIVHHTPNLQPYETGLGFTVENCQEAFDKFLMQGVRITRPIEGAIGTTRTFEILDPTGSSFTIFGP